MSDEQQVKENELTQEKEVCDVSGACAWSVTYAPRDNLEKKTAVYHTVIVVTPTRCIEAVPNYFHSGWDDEFALTSIMFMGYVRNANADEVLRDEYLHQLHGE